MTLNIVKTTFITAIAVALSITPLLSFSQPSHNKIKTTDLVLTNDNTEDIILPENFYDNWNSLHVAIRRLPYNALPENLSINLKEGNSDFVYPVKGQLLGQFCYRGKIVHTGIDIALKKGTPVHSSFDGVVRMAKYYGGYGKVVVVRHLNGIETLYGHLSKINVKVNQKVKAGDIVGLGGRTGRATANHLHFETRYNGNAFNPIIMMDFATFELLSDTMILDRADFLPKFKIVRSKKYGKKAVEVNYDENGRQIAAPIAVSETTKSVSTTDTLSATTEKPDDSSIPVVKKKTKNTNAKYVVVKSGDTLGRIAQKNGTNVKRLTQLNGISAGKTLQIGKRIRVR